MTDAATWIALGLSAVNSAALAGQAVVRSRRRRAFGPGAETRAALEALRHDGATITVRGGQQVTWFRDRDRDHGQRLDDLAGRTTDEQLAGHLRRAAASWREVFGNAFYDEGPIRVSDEALGLVGASQERRDQHRLETAERQINNAWRALDHADRAVERLNELERRL
jgi:hypothetical protein